MHRRTFNLKVITFGAEAGHIMHTKLNWVSHVQTHHVVVYTIAFALILRISLIIVGEIIDDISYTGVKYTDVDYNVFTDASRLMWDGNSPYDRTTYRYPPLLAFILIPNIFFPSFGKVWQSNCSIMKVIS